MRRLAHATLFAVASLAPLSSEARGADEAAFKDLKSRYDKLARNQDDNATRERRKILLESFDFRALKTCRTFLRKAYGDENTADNRIAAVQVLAASGDPKDVEFLLSAFKKEKSDGPQIALGEGIGYTDPEQAPAVSAWIGPQLAKSKGEPLRALLEGLGTLADPSGHAPTLALGDKLARAEQYERLIALGACGKAAAVPVLRKYADSPDGAIQLGATAGLARAGVPEALPVLIGLLRSRDGRVVEEAAAALAAAKHAEAAGPIADAFEGASLRTREALRAALKDLTGKDFGHDAEAWRKGAAGKAAPAVPKFFGTPVPSDRAVGILDLSRSMDWKSRLARARDGLAEWVGNLPDDATFDLVGGARTPVPFSERMVTGPAARQQAAEWIERQLTGGGFDLRESLLYVLRSRPEADTIVLATDSAPWGDSNEDTPLAVLEEFRRENRMRRLRVFVAFVAPGGRYEESEQYPEEFEDRKLLLRLLAETSGGTFTAIE